MTLDTERRELHLSAHNSNLIVRKVNHAQNTCPMSLEPPQVTRFGNYARPQKLDQRECGVLRQKSKVGINYKTLNTGQAFVDTYQL